MGQATAKADVRRHEHMASGKHQQLLGNPRPAPIRKWVNASDPLLSIMMMRIASVLPGVLGGILLFPLTISNRDRRSILKGHQRVPPVFRLSENGAQPQCGPKVGLGGIRYRVRDAGQHRRHSPNPINVAHFVGLLSYRPNVPQNLMFNRRVCRGSTFRSAAVAAAAAAQTPGRGSPGRSAHRSKTRTEGRAASRELDPRPSTPQPVAGRAHAPAQTKSYVEVVDEGLGECDQQVQTDEIVDLPLPVLFQPRLSGESKATEIGPGDLFDFESEVGCAARPAWSGRRPSY